MGAIFKTGHFVFPDPGFCKPQRFDFLQVTVGGIQYILTLSKLAQLPFLGRGTLNRGFL